MPAIVILPSDRAPVRRAAAGPAPPLPPRMPGSLPNFRFHRRALMIATGIGLIPLGMTGLTVFGTLLSRAVLVTVVTVVGLIGGHLLGGAVLVEQVFVIPGLGAMLVNGTLQKDFPTVQAVALALTIPVVLINLVVDVICATLDPRTRR